MSHHKTDKPNLLTSRHPSLEMPDEVTKKKQHHDMLTKAKNKFLNLSDALRTNKIPNGDAEHKRKSTLDYFFRTSSPKSDKNTYSNSRMREQRATSLQKQNSVGSYPLKHDVSEGEDDFENIERHRPATVATDRREELRQTAALALERPRKKLTFSEPEISGYVSRGCCQNSKKGAKKGQPEFKRSISAHNGTLRHGGSWDDLHLESQAMRVVRTVGQAFEVCHKLSINGPDPHPQDHDEQETLTQDLISDRISDVLSDKPKKDLLSETISDRHSLPAEDNLLNDFDCLDSIRSPRAQTEHPTINNTKKLNMVSGETYVSPLSDAAAFLTTATSGSGSIGNATAFSTGSATLSAQHEIQLLKEQLEQQSQQTQAALAQLQLVREQLAAEQGARMEAQARTHQLLVHNKELLDHIAALVSHLQGGEKGAQPHPGPHVAMPQQQQNQVASGDGYYHHPDRSDSNSLEQSPILQASVGLQPQGLIENRMVTSCLPPSPLRTTFNPSGSVFNFPFPTPQDQLEGQLLQRLQALQGYTYPYNYQQWYTPPLINSNYNLQPPPQKNLHQVIPTYTGSPAMERRPSPSRDFQQDQLNQNLSMSLNQLNINQNQNQLHVNQQTSLQSNQRLSPQQKRESPAKVNPSTVLREPHFIKPLSQLGTLTTTDVGGRVRVIVPIPSRSPDDDAGNLLASLRLGDDLRPGITRSTSEKVPNRSELMSQVQRTAWARHTTK